MKSESKTWENVKAKYLHQVEKALSSVKHPRRKEVLEDVCSHLDRRFTELGPDHQTWENFRAIITEMGPASDYAELLEPDAVLPTRYGQRKYLLWFGLATAIIIAAAISLQMAMSPKVGCIVTFCSVTLYRNMTAEDLLNEFNEECPAAVQTHHYRTQIRGSTLVGFVCVDTEEDKATVMNMLIQSKKLALLEVRAVTQRQLEQHYAIGLPSLKK